MKTLIYKGYKGSIEYSKEEKCYFGKVLGVSKKTCITYEGKTLPSLEKDFKNAINDYLRMCEARGWTPEKPYSGVLSLRLSADFHAKIAEMANNSNMSLNAFIKQTLQKAIL